MVKHQSKFWIAISSTIALGITFLLLGHQHKPEVQEDKGMSFLAPPTELPYLVLGYNEVVSDSLWLRVIQDIDRCEKPALDAKSQEIKTQQMNDILSKDSAGPVISRCGKGWVFHMLDSITELTPTPEFRLPYSLGGMALSVLVDDREGATALLEKGVRRYPDDWIILYRAAYHQLFEEKNQARASELLVRAGKNGGPQWLFLLAARLATAQGKAMLAKSIIEEQLQAATTPEKKAELQKRLDYINETLREDGK